MKLATWQMQTTHRVTGEMNRSHIKSFSSGTKCNLISRFYCTIIQRVNRIWKSHFGMSTSKFVKGKFWKFKFSPQASAEGTDIEAMWIEKDILPALAGTGRARVYHTKNWWSQASILINRWKSVRIELVEMYLILLSIFHPILYYSLRT